MRITAEMIIECNPCDKYSHDLIREIVGDGLTLLELCNLNFPVGDILWVFENVKSIRFNVGKMFWLSYIKASNENILWSLTDTLEKTWLNKIRKIAEERNL